MTAFPLCEGVPDCPETATLRLRFLTPVPYDRPTFLLCAGCWATIRPVMESHKLDTEVKAL